jgi:hypothetical protein
MYLVVEELIYKYYLIFIKKNNTIKFMKVEIMSVIIISTFFGKIKLVLHYNFIVMTYIKNKSVYFKVLLLLIDI